ncbi:hypothetical protein SCUCBS95973_008420 [Sporothrix curviconia]|uniref:Uncharacterized protein n=1 Tax=Sporothrix curviconia TaxID=1260050 RepID=A0ABP0CMY4_9PEZI
MASPSDSSVTSFRTAQEGSPDASKSTTISSNLNGLINNVNNINGHQEATKDNTHTPVSPYRPVRDIPYQLRDHIRVYLEEKMYGEAIHLLTSLLAAGGSDALSLPSATSMVPATTADTPVWLPPASHLSVLASLAVHPAYTTRPQDGTDMRVAGHAIQYLRHVLAVAGPVGAEMASAFEYRDTRGKRTSSAKAAAARARAAATTGRGRDSICAIHTNANSTSTSRASSANRPRRQLRASAGRSSLNTGEYVDSQTMSWSDDEYGGGGKQTKPKRKSKGGREDVSMGERDVFRNDGRNGLDDATAAAAAYDNGDDDDDNDFADEDNDEDAVSSRMATRDGVWVRGQNFWRVAAWALTCSVREPERWRCWQPWLTLMVDVLEADFVERLQDIAQGDGDGDGDNNGGDLYDSLLFQYLSDDSGSGGNGSSSTTNLRHLASAILADGSQPAALAREIFDKETVITSGSAATSTARPVRKLDLDNDKFGDYSDDDESAPPTPESSPSPSPSPFGKKSTNKTSTKKTLSSSSSASKFAEVSDCPGFLESLPLRRRLFYLVALGSLYFPDAFATSDALYRAFAQVLREADISVFAAFVAAPPPPSAFSSPTTVLRLSPDNIFVGLLRHILFTYLPASAPKPHIVDPDAIVTSLPSSRVLERCFLPFAANTVLLGANVRMALALESLFRITWQPALSPQGDDELLWSPTLQKAAEAGVHARETRAKSSSGRVEAYGRDLLKRSGSRLLAMVQLARIDAGEPEMVLGDI